MDARAGPGTKSMYKIKNRSTGERQEPTTILRKKHKHKHKRVSRVIALGSRRPQSPGTLSDDVMCKCVLTQSQNTDSCISIKTVCFKCIF